MQTKELKPGDCLNLHIELRGEKRGRIRCVLIRDVIKVPRPVNVVLYNITGFVITDEYQIEIVKFESYLAQIEFCKCSSETWWNQFKKYVRVTYEYKEDVLGLYYISHKPQNNNINK